MCFCGTGKKIKFCCKDLLPDLEKIVKALNGKQYAAAGEAIDRALARHPNRASLWALKLDLLRRLDRLADDPVGAGVGRGVGADLRAVAPIALPYGGR